MELTRGWWEGLNHCGGGKLDGSTQHPASVSEDDGDSLT